MNKTEAGLAVVAILAIGAAGGFVARELLDGEAEAANRVTVDLDTSVTVFKTELWAVADGGCAVVAFAKVTRQDGGTFDESSGEPFHVSGANRTACLSDMVNSTALFKAQRGF